MWSLTWLLSAELFVRFAHDVACVRASFFLVWVSLYCTMDQFCLFPPLADGLQSHSVLESEFFMHAHMFQDTSLAKGKTNSSANPKLSHMDKGSRHYIHVGLFSFVIILIEMVICVSSS